MITVDLDKAKVTTNNTRKYLNELETAPTYGLLGQALGQIYGLPDGANKTELDEKIKTYQGTIESLAEIDQKRADEIAAISNLDELALYKKNLENMIETLLDDKGGQN